MVFSFELYKTATIRFKRLTCRSIFTYAGVALRQGDNVTLCELALYGRVNSPVKENMMDDMKDCWLSVEDICKSLGVSKDTFWTEIDGMPAHRQGRLWKSIKEGVDDWVRVSGAAEQGKTTSGITAVTKERK